MTAQPDPAAELRAAAALLRVPLALPFELALAELLDDMADGDEYGEHNPYALAVARALLGGSDG